VTSTGDELTRQGLDVVLQERSGSALLVYQRQP